MIETIEAPAIRLADVQQANRPLPDLRRVHETVESHYPGIWPAVNAGLATCATLLLADNANPTALIYVGAASGGKTTVADMFVGTKLCGELLCHRSDKFTPAAFVSHAANKTTKELDHIDLLPRIQHKVLVTPELAPIFRGKDDELADRFAVLTRVLDGQGYKTDSGNHGERGTKVITFSPGSVVPHRSMTKSGR